MTLSKPKKTRHYGYQIEGRTEDGEFGCSDSYLVSAESFDDAVEQVKKLMKEKNEARRRDGCVEYSEITELRLFEC